MLGQFRTQLDRVLSKQDAAHECNDDDAELRALDFHIKVLPKAIDAERCSIFIVNAQGDTAWLKRGTGVEEKAIKIQTKGSIAGQVIESGKAVIENDMAHRDGPHKAIEQETGYLTHSVACVPIKSPSRKEVTGAIQVLNKKNGSGFTQEDVALLEDAATCIQRQIDHIFLNQEVIGVAERLYGFTRRVTMVAMLSVLILATLFALYVVGLAAAPKLF